ncbi:oxidative stress-induced growth inhibitor 1 [Brachionus plicatilis]|uniref:Oxidative stress-induced growth inhibitor 1 n=1 Tax=Brachionus plicatilis TaxID=10195 RepID=A0A3M7S9T0_BRAPC|nr:oxidative stress-induced growth inhibitor 1 [Brachionus plicatilis]
MPNCAAIINTINVNRPIGGYKDVVIIGNGPSGLCLSYFLSGHWPYYNKNVISDEFLQTRLDYLDNNLSLVEHDLEYLSNGLEGRSFNPIALLYDKLKHPDADLGLDLPSCLNWKYDPNKEIDHVCIGKAAGPGGSWNDLDGSQLTISPSRWMELPELVYSDWKRQNKSSSSVNAGLVFSSKSSNFSEDNSLLNANVFRKSTPKALAPRALSAEESRASMNDVRNYYRDYVKQKNLDKYLLNSATVTNVRRVCCSKLVLNAADNSHATCSIVPCNSVQSVHSATNVECLWEVTGIVDKRERKKASSLTQKGDLIEFKYYCKHLVLAIGACDIHNRLNVKGENHRYILSSMRELEDKIKEDLARLQKEPLLIVGSGLSAADAILLAKKYHIRIVHVIKKSVYDPNLIFNKLPKKIYPEYHKVYEQMLSSKGCHSSSTDLSQSYTLYDEHEIKNFTSKRTCVLTSTREQSVDGLMFGNDGQSLAGLSRDTEIKVSYACVLIGYSPDLSFLPSYVHSQLAVDPQRPLNTKENPISIDECTHESSRFKNLYAMGPLIGDNFVRFGTGGALAITSSIWKDLNSKKEEICVQD